MSIREAAVDGNQKPKALAVNTDLIPQALKDLPQFVVWRYVPEVDKETGDTDWDKPPVNARTGRLASSTNRKTWSTFDYVVAAYQRGGLDGIGFVLTEELGIVGIDLDKCRNPETGIIDDWALDIIKTVNTYTEVSPSGRGIRMFLFGRLPPVGRKKGHYENYQTKRYVTVTGQHVDGTPLTIEQRQAELESVHRGVFGEPQKVENVPHGGAMPTNLDDAEVVRRAAEMKGSAGAKFRKLWDGDTSGQGNDHSRADLALCGYLAFWCGPDEGRISELFRQSALFRSKWNRDDYRARTIAKALAGRTEFYTPQAHNRHKSNGTPDQAARPAVNAEIHLTDRGNALRLVQRHGGDLRYCHPWSKWLLWDGKRWRLDDMGGIMARAKETIAHAYREAAEQLKQLAAGLEGGAGADPERDMQKLALQRTVKHFLASEATKALRAMVDSAQSEAGIPVLPADLDRDPMLLNVVNGTLDLRTGELRPHRRADMLTKLCPVEYRPDAKCPTWERLLKEILPNTDLVRFIQLVLGYCLTASVVEQVLLILWGCGSNGKSTFLNVILEILGLDYAIKGASDLLLRKRDTHPTEKADLFGRRVVVCLETDEGQRLAESLVKDLTGGDRQRARRMREDFWEFNPTHKLFLCTNHKPKVKGKDHALWRRLRLVPFSVVIADDRQDKQLPAKLRAEYPGILRWMVEGCSEWQRSGLGHPEAVKKATADYREEQDIVAGFLAECCNVNPDYRVKASRLYARFKVWCEAVGEADGRDIPSQRKVGEALTARGYARVPSNGTWYLGLDLRQDEEELGLE